MKIQPQLNEELRPLATMIEPMSVAMLTTADGNGGALASRPMSPLAMDASGAIVEDWDAPNSKMVRMFAMAASVLAGQPIGLGDHAKHIGLDHRAPASAVS